jgi:hypothetical protein
VAILTNLVDEKLEKAKKEVVATLRVCPACAKPFTASAETLHAINPDLGMIMHKCPACGHELWSVKLPT